MQTNLSLVSIIIVNYNGFPELARCLNSLITSGEVGRNEIIVVDNCSTDGSVEALKPTFPWVKLVVNERNSGYGHGNNLGRFHANGKYLAFLNPDTEVTPGWLEPLITVLDSDPEVGLVTPRLHQKAEPEILNACGHQVHLTGIVQCRGLGKTGDLYRDREEVNAVSGAAFVIRGELFDLLGGFDEPFFMYIEDTDLSWRARLAGYSCVYVPESIVYHDYELSFGPRKLFYYERNRYNLLVKNLHWATLGMLLPALAIAEVIAWGFVFLHNRAYWRNKLDAYRWMIQNWYFVSRERQRVQSLRTLPDHELIGQLSTHLVFEQVGSPVISWLGNRLLNPFFVFYKAALMAVLRW